MKLPRYPSKRRAVVDLLRDGKEHTRRELFNAYLTAGKWRSNPNYISCTISSILEEFAIRVRRGVYIANFDLQLLDDDITFKPDEAPFVRIFTQDEVKSMLFEKDRKIAELRKLNNDTWKKLQEAWAKEKRVHFNIRLAKESLTASIHKQQAAVDELTREV